MGHEASANYEKIQRCEAAIVRIREAKRAGRENSEAVGDDINFIIDEVSGRLSNKARQIGRGSPLLAEEAFELMLHHLVKDVLSLTYGSMATQFGAYLRHLPARAANELGRKHPEMGASFKAEPLDAEVGEDGLLRHETIADPAAADVFEAIGVRKELEDAIAQLPPDERHVFLWRFNDVDNNEIARRLGVSPATATRVYQRAIKKLRRQIDRGEE